VTLFVITLEGSHILVPELGTDAEQICLLLCRWGLGHVVIILGSLIFLGSLGSLGSLLSFMYIHLFVIFRSDHILGLPGRLSREEC
jgi:hypothetical protein